MLPTGTQMPHSVVQKTPPLNIPNDTIGWNVDGQHGARALPIRNTYVEVSRTRSHKELERGKGWGGIGQGREGRCRGVGWDSVGWGDCYVIAM